MIGDLIFRPYGEEVASVHPPEKIRVLVERPIAIYTDRPVKKTFIIPSADGGYREYDVWVDDTPEGIYKFQCDQAKILGQKMPPDPWETPMKFVWRVQYTFRGTESHVDVDVADYPDPVLVQHKVLESLMRQYP